MNHFLTVTRKITIRGMLWVAGLLLVSGGSAATELEKVTLQLKWRHQFQFAGYYAAHEQGYYREAGLDVELVEAEPATDPVAEVTSGRAQFGVGNSALLLARHEGKPVVVLAAIYQHSPLVLLARSAADISSVHDLRGKRVMLEPHSDELRAYLRKEGIAESQLKLLPHNFDAQNLIRGNSDAVSAYNTDETFFLEQAGFKYQLFSPRSAGIDFYGDNLFTSEAELRAHPERVKAFRDASLRGWRYAMQHREELVDLIITRYGERHTRQHLLYEARKMQPLLLPEQVEMGYMYPGRWRHIADTYAELGLLPENFPLQGFLYDLDAGQKRTQQQMTLAIWVVVLVGVVFAVLALVLLRLNRRLQREIVAREETTTELRESERNFRFITENSADVIWTLDIASRRFTYVSPSVARLRGYSVEEVMARPMTAALSPESAQRAEAVLDESIAAWENGDRRDTRRVTELDQPHKDGRLVPTEVVTTLHADAEGRPVSVLGVSRDITDRRRAEQLQREVSARLQAQLAEIQKLHDSIQEQAVRDPLTNLYNRRYLDENFERELTRAKRDGYPLSLAVIDIDHFKRVNDTYGHPAGDQVLRALAQLLLRHTRASDIACRHGGEEFLLLMPNIGAENARARAEALRQDFQNIVVPHGELQIHATFSAGIAAFPEHGHSVEQLGNAADSALYASKHGGRNRVSLCSETNPAA